MDDHVAGSVKGETEHTRAWFSRVCHSSVCGKQKGKCCMSARIIREDFPEEVGLELDLTEYAGMEKRERRKEGRQAGRMT